MSAYEERILRTMEAFRRNRYDVSRFAERTAAADHLAAEIRGKRVGFGDSETLRALSLYERLSEHNEVIDPPRAGHEGGIEAFLAAGREALMTDIFVLSANAVTEHGQILNMDGAGNRVAGSLFGHEKTYFVVGINKLVPDIAAGIERIHLIAHPRDCRPAQCTPQGEEDALRKGWYALLRLRGTRTHLQRPHNSLQEDELPSDGVGADRGGIGAVKAAKSTHWTQEKAALCRLFV